MKNSEQKKNPLSNVNLTRDFWALYFLMLVNFANIFFCIKKYRKDTLKSFRINLANKFIGGIKMSHTQLIKDTLNILDLNIYFEENCLT
ncbi:hypothetical protein, partial [Enterococcus durans]|uniref:hypothetical protein n=1 Tax=Enterococcus durans TaxID=53345 RepID=UPI001EEEEA89